MAAREIVARKGFDCSIREIATKSDISYGHVHRSWESKEALLEDAERMLLEELEAALGDISPYETVSILLVKVWYGLQSVTHARSFLLQTLKPEYPKSNLENVIVNRLTSACEHHPLAKSTDPKVLAITLYMAALVSDPDLLQGACQLFGVDHLPEDLNIMCLNQINIFLSKTKVQT